MNYLFKLSCIFILCFFLAGAAAANLPGPEFNSEIYVVPSVTTVSSYSFHDTSTSISPAAQQTVADTYVNPESDTTTASNDSWFFRALSTAGDPVDMATGEFYHEELPDIIIPSRGLNLSICQNL